MNLPMPIIVGAPRSGTTLLRFMLDAHPALAIPPETGFLALASAFTQPPEIARAAFFEQVTHYPPEAPNWIDFQLSPETYWQSLCALEPFTVAEGFRTFYRLYAARFGKARWGDKTPSYSQFMTGIAAVLPEAHFIHLIRDGRDVALSLRPLWFSPGWEIETQARYWQHSVVTARAQGRLCQHYFELQYESLVAQPEVALRQLCDFLALPFDASMLAYHERSPARLKEHQARLRADGSLLISQEQRWAQQQLTTERLQPSRAQAWKTSMNDDERQCFESIAGALLQELGYETQAAHCLGRAPIAFH